MKRVGWVLGGLVLAGSLAVPASHLVRSLRMTGGGMATFARLVSSGNAGDLDSVRSLCSRRYLGSRAIEASPEGGVVGLPRNIHKNFRVWREGDEVWLCPTDRVGPVYRMVFEEGSWKFDGPVGLLGPGGRVDRAASVDDFL